MSGVRVPQRPLNSLPQIRRRPAAFAPRACAAAITAKPRGHLCTVTPRTPDETSRTLGDLPPSTCGGGKARHLLPAGAAEVPFDEFHSVAAVTFPPGEAGDIDRRAVELADL